MIKSYVALHVLSSLIFQCAVAHDDSILDTAVTYEDLKIKLTWNSEKFFSGSMEVLQKEKRAFYADSFFSAFLHSELTDLNDDGKEELLLHFHTGVNMYDYNMVVLFDRSIGNIPLFEVHNCETRKYENGKTRLSSYVRLSPSIFGMGYAWELTYINGKLLPYFHNDAETTKDLKEFRKEIISIIKEYQKENDICTNEYDKLIFFEAYGVQSRIYMDTESGWRFFDKYYLCKDKNDARTKLAGLISDDFNYILKEDYKFKSGEDQNLK